MMRLLVFAAALSFSNAPPVLCQSPLAEQHIRELINEALRAERPQPFARLMMQADTEAAALERAVASPSGDIRSLKIPNFGNLHYRWNDVQQNENYEHDLLLRVVHELRGTTAGADALVALLKLGPYGGPWFDHDELLPDEFSELSLHRRIIAVIDSPSWRKLHDTRLILIEAEAYETWWSLSRAATGDPELSQNGVTRSDYSAGADSARLKAIQLYETILAINGDTALRSRIAALRNRHDTHQRAWFRGGD